MNTLKLRTIFAFGLRTRQQTLIRPIDNQKRTREQIRVEIDDPEKEARELAIEREHQKKQLEQSILNLKFNDANPANYIQVKVRQQQLVQQSIQPLIVHSVPRLEKKLIQGVRRKIPASIKKLAPTCRPYIGMHILQALDTVKAQPKKVHRFIYSALNMVKSHATQAGCDIERLFVHALISGKHQRWQKLYYHAKGKMGRMHRNTSQLRVILEEKPTLELFTSVIEGKAPYIIGTYIKQSLVNDQSNLDRVRALQPYLTAKGRQQQRLMLKRRVQKQLIENKKENKKISSAYIHQQIVKEEAQKLAEHFETKKLANGKSNIEQRQTLFKRNEETNI